MVLDFSNKKEAGLPAVHSAREDRATRDLIRHKVPSSSSTMGAISPCAAPLNLPSVVECSETADRPRMRAQQLPAGACAE